MIKPMTDEESKRAIERAKANSLDEYGNYGENNGPLPETKEEPTVEVDDSGNKFWYLNGKLHREDGPAIERADGNKSWYLNGVNVTEEDVMGNKKVDYADFVEDMVMTYGRDRLAENTLGLVGEAGEVAEKVKKFFRDNKLDEEAIQKELGDVIFYWYALHGALQLDPEVTINKNREKLSSRKERRTLRGSGDNR